MAALLSSVSPIALPATLSPPGAAPGAPNLAAFVELMAKQTGTTPAALAAPARGIGDRQDDAAPGKILPDGGAKDATDPALAWLLAGQMPIVVPRAIPAPTAPAVAVAPAALTPSLSDAVCTKPSPIALTNITIAPDTGTSDVGPAPTDMPALSTGINEQGAQIVAPLPAREGPGVGSPVVGDTHAASATSPVAIAERETGGSRPSNQPTPNPSLPGRGLRVGQAGMPQPAIDVLPPVLSTIARSLTAGPALTASASPAVLADKNQPVPTTATEPVVEPPHAAHQPVAPAQLRPPAAPVAVAREMQMRSSAPVSPAALPALFALAAATDRPTERDDRAATVLSLDPAAAAAASSAAVAPTADPQRQSLDMGRHDWPQRMIEHIEALRDDADARDTSIRLKPEALGRVDVALRTHDDGAVSVRFTAEQPATRTLIADAAPQLREAAEARGIRLSQTSVDLSQHGSDQRARSDAAPRLPTANHLAGTTGDDTDAVDDGRIA